MNHLFLHLQEKSSLKCTHQGCRPPLTYLSPIKTLNAPQINRVRTGLKLFLLIALLLVTLTAQESHPVTVFFESKMLEKRPTFHLGPFWYQMLEVIARSHGRTHVIVGRMHPELQGTTSKL